ncbi:5-formyltetrahydrofolate cyclo-ligase [Paraclostridium bifermentans]|uniref:5-formyltetrahydrofolate cyclo-ligase n=1 Tax=Paraclostridium bifermentans TaxID=1490 RepID=A0ABY8R4P8_PARBF|nr:5-formyltetrahydrofolate cyclo-ligase [Paraclostridium bifermentans]
MKKDFRKKVIELRKKQSPQSIIYKSKKISDIILSLEDIKKASTIMLYLDFNNEVKTDILVNSLISLGKKY